MVTTTTLVTSRRPTKRFTSSRRVLGANGAARQGRRITLTSGNCPGVGKSSIPAPFPVELPWRAMTCTDVAGDGVPVVLDPFIGSGTTAVAALQADWDYVGVDQSAEYCRQAGLRLVKENLKLNGVITLDNLEHDPPAPPSGCTAGAMDSVNTA